jgi:GT2 family glycosyltransferase
VTAPHAAPLRDRLSVVIATRNRLDSLRPTLAHLASLPDPPHVVVVDDASEAPIAERVRREFPEVELIARTRWEGPVARNHGVRRARTPYVALTDDDCRWEPGALERAVDVLDRHPRVAAIAACIVVGDDQRPDPICDEMARSPVPGDSSIPGVPILSFMGGATVLRRRAFCRVGGFERRLIAGGEEELLAGDLAADGWELRYVPEVLIHHHPPGGDKRFDRVLGIRNALWFAWRRRPARSALRWTLYMLRAMPLNRTSLSAVVQALRGLRWVLATRRVVPPHVEAGLRALDRDKMTSDTRTYG